MDGPCAACGSMDTSALGDAFGCQSCGAATSYDGGLVHGPSGLVEVAVVAEPEPAPKPKAKKKK